MAQFKLSIKTVQNTKPSPPGGPIKHLSDGGGLHLRIRPYAVGLTGQIGGQRDWIARFRHGGRENMIKLGDYPQVGLADARTKLGEVRALLAEGRNPVLTRRTEVQARIAAQAHSFSLVAADWITNNRSRWSDHHIERNEGLIRRVLNPKLRTLPIADISTPILNEALTDYQQTTAENVKRPDAGIESTRRARDIASQIFRFAIAKGLAVSNPAEVIDKGSDLFKKRKVKSFAALPQADVGPFLVKLDESAKEGGRASPVVRTALLIAMMTGLRDASLRAAKWHEIDLDAALWTVPAERMKSGREHLVPLPRQAVELLKALAPLTRIKDDSYVFANKAGDGHLAENTLTKRIQSLEFDATVHGMRSLMTDVLNLAGFNRDAIERQLDHVEKNAVRAAYLRDDFMSMRRPMIQWYADWMDAKRGNKSDPPVPNAHVADSATANSNQHPSRT